MENDGYNVIGIDLGTTNSCVAVWKSQQLQIVINEMGLRVTPSVVSFLPTETLVGSAALKSRRTNPLNTVFDTKRLIGHSITDKEIQFDLKNWPFRVNCDKDGNPIISVDKSDTLKVNYYPEEISAMILKHLKKQAESFAGRELKNAVITVPAYFNANQRKATEKAACLAGLNVVKLLNEPSAAAFTYTYENKKEAKTILVYDLGGGTFDVSILNVSENKVKVVACKGDSHLGGEDFDSNLVDYLVEVLKQNGIDISNDTSWRAKLREAAESCKIELSFSSTSLVELENPEFSCVVTRITFETLNKALFEKTIDTVKKTIEQAHMEVDAIDEIVLVGGSTRIPLIQQMLMETFPKSKLCKSVNPDEAVAMGAAIFGSALEAQGSKKKQQNARLSIGVETQGGIMDVILPRGIPLPASYCYNYVTPTDNQPRAVIRLFMGERLLTRDNVSIGEFSLEGIPLSRAGGTTIEIRVTLTDLNELSVKITGKGVKSCSFKTDLMKSTKTAGLLQSGEGVRRCIAEAEKSRSHDNELVRRHKEMNVLECLLEEGFSLLFHPTAKMTSDWVKQQRDLLISTKAWMQANPDAEIREIKERDLLIRKAFVAYLK